MNLFKTSIAAVAIVAMATSGAAFAATTVCKDSTGKVITCPAKPASATVKPAPAAKPAATTAAKPATAPATAKPAAKPAPAAAPAKPATAAAAKPATTATPAKPATTTAAKPAKSAAKSAAAPKTSIATKADPAAPAGAGGKCKDGAYSMTKSHSGACSRHGGVAYWIG